MDKPRAPAAYVLPFVCLVCWHCAKDPSPPGPCNDLAADAPAHDFTYVTGPLPTATGGTIEDGLYYEYSTEVFDPSQTSVPSGAQRSVTTSIAGQTWRAAYKVTAPSGTEAGTETYLISPVTTGAGQLVMTRTCPTDRPMSTPFGYSFSGSGPGAILQLIFDGSPPMVYALARQ